MAKKVYELKANVGHAVTTLPNGKTLELKEGDSYETANGEEQATLDAFDGVKVTETKGKS